MLRTHHLAPWLAAAAMAAWAGAAPAGQVDVTNAAVNDTAGTCPGAPSPVCTASGGTVTGSFDLAAGQIFEIDTLASGKKIVFAAGDEVYSASFVFDWTGALNLDNDAFEFATLELTLDGDDLNDATTLYTVAFETLVDGGAGTFVATYTIDNQTFGTTNIDLVFNDVHLTGFDLSIVSDGTSIPGGPPPALGSVAWARTDFTPASVLLAANAVPEPGTGMILGLGLAGIALLRRRRPS